MIKKTRKQQQSGVLKATGTGEEVRVEDEWDVVDWGEDREKDR